MTLWLQAGLWGLLAGGALVIGAAVAWLVRVPQRVVAADRLPGLPASEAALESLWLDRRGPEAAGSRLHHDPRGDPHPSGLGRRALVHRHVPRSGPPRAVGTGRPDGRPGLGMEPGSTAVPRAKFRPVATGSGALPRYAHPRR